MRESNGNGGRGIHPDSVGMHGRILRREVTLKILNNQPVE